MKRLYVALPLFFVVLRARAEEPATRSPELTDAKAVMTRCVEAMAKAKTVAYKANYAPTGWLKEFAPTIEGTVVLGKESEHKVLRFRCTLKFQQPESSETEDVDAGSDGATFYILDGKTKTVHADMDPAVIGKNSWPLELVRIEAFGNPNKFADDLKKGEQTLIEGKTVGGEDCYGVFVKAEVPLESKWYVSKKDFLPRQVSAVYTGGPTNEPALSELTITELVVDPGFPKDKDPFAVPLPEGYKKSDEFLP